MESGKAAESDHVDDLPVEQFLYLFMVHFLAETQEVGEKSS